MRARPCVSTTIASEEPVSFIINPHRFGGGAASLLTGVIAFWKLEEASGTRVDEVGSNDLTDNNTVTQTTGKIGNAAQFTAANSETLSIADNADLSFANTDDFTFSCWVYLDSTGGSQQLITKRTSNLTGTNLEYMLRTDAGVPTFYYGYGAGSFDSVASSTTLSTSTWYFILFWHDQTANTINVSVDNGSPNTATKLGTIADQGNTFYLGGTTSEFLNGRLDAVGLWGRLLTSGEKAALYNSGNGLEHPF
jgi:hypothetical protein